MDIRGLGLTEISGRLEKYVIDYFNGYALSAGQCLFAESYLLYFDEVKHLIPDKHHHLFKDTDKFNGASGFIKSGDGEQVLMLLTDEKYTKALLLCVQRTDEDGNERNVVLQDFICQSE